MTLLNVPWWFLKSMVGVHENVSFVRIFGLRSTTYIFPWRILHQYGLRQMIPTMDIIPQPSLEVHVASISAWYEYMVKLLHWIITKNRLTQVRPSFSHPGAPLERLFIQYGKKFYIYSCVRGDDFPESQNYGEEDNLGRVHDEFCINHYEEIEL